MSVDAILIAEAFGFREKRNQRQQQRNEDCGIQHKEQTWIGVRHRITADPNDPFPPPALPRRRGTRSARELLDRKSVV